jgi:hypothetical protein
MFGPHCRVIAFPTFLPLDLGRFRKRVDVGVHGEALWREAVEGTRRRKVHVVGDTNKN